MTPQPKWSTKIDLPRPLFGQSLDFQPSTIVEIVTNAAENRPDCLQYVSYNGEEHTTLQFYQLVRNVAKACIHLGLQPNTGISIMGFNSVEWFAADVAANFAAAYSAGIYTTNKPDIVAHIINSSNSRLIFVDDEQALENVLSIVQDCPQLTNIIVWGDVDLSKYDKNAQMILSWNQFLKLADNVSDETIDNRTQLVKPESIAKLIYTSGTTGPPKAVMISHDNSCWTCHMLGTVVKAGPGDHIVSFLPSSHIAANGVDINGALMNGYCIHFASPDALRGSLVETLRKVRPTLFLAVPRVFEKIHETMIQIGSKNSQLKQWIAAWAKDLGKKASDMRDDGDDGRPLFFGLANKIVFENIRKNLGLDRCHFIVNAAAPLQRATDDYFRSLFIKIIDLYGMSEATGPLTVNYPDYKRGTSGKPCPGIEVKLSNNDETGEGELCFRGRNVFVGYLEHEEETKKTIDDDGFIHSGDLGKIDADGFVTITGRAKELIVTAGGENVAPAIIEGELTAAMSAISRAFVIGDKKKFISCLLVPFMELDGTLIGKATQVNPNVKHVSDIATDAEWKKYIEQGLAVANGNAVSNATKVKKYTILQRDFGIDTGELTPTMKPKRKIIVSNFSAEINAMYDTQ